MRQVEAPTWARQVLDEHRELRAKVAELRDFLEAPRPRPGASGAHTWSAGLSLRLVSLHDELFRHFRFEDEGGMAEELSIRHPRAATDVDRLVGDHPRILDRVRVLVQDSLLYSQEGEVSDPALRRRVHDLIAWLESHERDETHMIQSLECDDLGRGD